MKKLMIVCVAVAMLTGCETTRPSVASEKEPPARQRLLPPSVPEDAVEVKKTGKPTLYELTDAYEERRPEKYGFYENDSRKIKIFQVCFEVDEQTKKETHYVLARGEDLIIAVISDREYVEDEYLLPGKYCYCGPYQYRTAPVVQGVQTAGTKTVRMFVEVTDEKVEKSITSMRQAEEAAKKSK